MLQFYHGRANSVFWTRALTIPFPHSYVFPQPVGDATSACDESNLKISQSQIVGEAFTCEKDERSEVNILDCCLSNYSVMVFA